MSEPNWGNTHEPTCPIAIERPVLWAEFCEALCVDLDDSGPITERMSCGDALSSLLQGATKIVKGVPARQDLQLANNA